MEVGQLCIKLAGRDAGRKCVIADLLDNNFVLIDGETRRRKCNINHLEPLQQKIDIRKGASHEAVVDAFKKIGLDVKDKKSKQTPKRVLSKRVLNAQPKKAVEQTAEQETKPAEQVNKPQTEKKLTSKKTAKKQEK